MTTKREPAGVPTGGQFACMAHTETDTELTEPYDEAFGDASLGCRYVRYEDQVTVTDSNGNTERFVIDPAYLDDPRSDPKTAHLYWAATVSCEDVGTFTAPQTFATALINGDFSGLDHYWPEDSAEARELLNKYDVVDCFGDGTNIEYSYNIPKTDPQPEGAP